MTSRLLPFDTQCRCACGHNACAEIDGEALCAACVRARREDGDDLCLCGHRRRGHVDSRGRCRASVFCICPDFVERQERREGAEERA